MDEAERLADQVVVIDRGRVVATGTPRELTARGAEDCSRSAARPGWRSAGLELALPEGSRATETPPGAYRVDGLRRARSCWPR